MLPTILRLYFELFWRVGYFMLFILSKITCGDNLCWLFFFFSNIFQPIKSEEHKYCMLKHSILSLCYIVRSSTHDHDFILVYNLNYSSFHPFLCLYVPSSVLWCPLRFPHKNVVRFVFIPSCLLGVHDLFTLFVFVCA